METPATPSDPAQADADALREALAGLVAQVARLAVARGLPVIATTGGAIPESLPAGTGILVTPGDVAALTAALQEMIGQPDVRAQHAAASRRAAEHLPRWPLSAQLFAQAVAAVVP